MNIDERSSFPSPPPYQEKVLQDLSVPDYDLDAKELIPITSTTKALELVYTKSYINLRIMDSVSNDVFYYADNSSFTPGKADVTLCRGNSKDGPVVGVCRWSRLYSKHLSAGIGKPGQNESNTVWAGVRTDNIIQPIYKWSIGSPNNRNRFAWRRINKDDMRKEDEEANKLSRKSFKLVNCADGEILAVLASHRFKSLSKLGKLIIKVDGCQRGWGIDSGIYVISFASGYH